MNSHLWFRNVFLLICSAWLFHARVDAQGSQPEPRQRVLVLTDIEADPDDAQSLVRLLLYSNALDIEAIVATTSIHQKTRVAPESIHKILDAYGKVHYNLMKHEAGFPTAVDLKKRVTTGLAIYGMKGVGDGHDSPGSEKIIELLETPDPRPLWVSVWGGPNTLAQALYKLKQTRSAEDLSRLVSKLRVYTISDQDDSGIWMRQNFPDLFYIVSPGSYRRSTWGAINMVVDGIDNSSIGNQWLSDNIQQSHGPLGAEYPDVAWGMEGDTPAYLGLIPNGLNEPDRPNWGGWGGRYEISIPDSEEINVGGMVEGGVPILAETRPIWTNAEDTFAPRLFHAYGRANRPDEKSHTGNRVTLWRWRDDVQNDFAARMDWCLATYENANHPPIPNLAHPERFTVDSGEAFQLDAGGTVDPDGDNMSFTWMQYPEAGSSPIKVDFKNFPENVYQVSRIAPEVDKTETLHFILKVTDKGTPPLTRYKRVVVTVEPTK